MCRSNEKMNLVSLINRTTRQVRAYESGATRYKDSLTHLRFLDEALVVEDLQVGFSAQANFLNLLRAQFVGSCHVCFGRGSPDRAPRINFAEFVPVPTDFRE